jgi:hypothetical protein
LERTPAGKCKKCKNEQKKAAKKRARENNPEKYREKERARNRRRYNKNPEHFRQKQKQSERRRKERNSEEYLKKARDKQKRRRMEKPELVAKSQTTWLARRNFMLMTGTMFRIRGLCEEMKTKPNNENENE